MKTIVKSMVLSGCILLNASLITGSAVYGGKKGVTIRKHPANSVKSASFAGGKSETAPKSPANRMETAYLGKKATGTTLEYPAKTVTPVFVENKEVKAVRETSVHPEEAVFMGNKEGATTQEYFDNLRGMHPSRSSEQDQFSLDMINDKKSGKIDGMLRIYRWTHKGVEHVHATVQTSSGGWQGPQPAEGYYGQIIAAEDFEYLK